MFPGQENPKPVATRPLRTFTWNRYPGGGPTRTVQANYLTYAASHIVFLADRPGGTPDFIVLAEHVDNVHHLEETP